MVHDSYARDAHSNYGRHQAVRYDISRSGSAAQKCILRAFFAGVAKIVSCSQGRYAETARRQDLRPCEKELAELQLLEHHERWNRVDETAKIICEYSNYPV